MPLPLTVSCFSTIQIGFTFLVPAHPCSPGQRAVKRVCTCVTYGRGSVLLWQHSDMLHFSGFMDDAIFAHKLRLFKMAARLRQWGSQAAFGLASMNTCCRQWMLGTISCSQGLLHRSWHVEYLWNHVPAYIATRKWCVLKVTLQVGTQGTESTTDLFKVRW